jgi:hypothetical protein
MVEDGMIPYKVKTETMKLKAMMVMIIWSG